MNPFRRILGRRAVDPEHDYRMAVLRLRLLVSMAAADEQLLDEESDVLAASIAGPTMSEPHRMRLREELERLLADPPRLEDVIGALAISTPPRPVAERLARELAQLAAVDGRIDDREEELLRMVCAAMRIRPLTMRRHFSRERPLTPREQARFEQLLRDASRAA